MALGDLTRQLAEQAIRSPMKDALEALRPGDQPAAPAQGDSLCATILGQVQAMQKALKTDEELLVLFRTGAETLRVTEIFVPSWQVAVLIGLDAEKNLTRVITPVESLQLVCKVRRVPPPAKPLRVGFISPKPKE